MVEDQIDHQAIFIGEISHVLPCPMDAVDLGVVLDSKAIVGRIREKRQDMHASQRVANPFRQKPAENLKRRQAETVDCIRISDEKNVLLIP